MNRIINYIDKRRYCKYFSNITINNNDNVLFIEKLKTILCSNSNILTEKDDDFKKYNTDWTKTFQGGKLICFPRNTNDVSNIVKLCNKYNISIVPQGKTNYNIHTNSNTSNSININIVNTNTKTNNRR